MASSREGFAGDPWPEIASGGGDQPHARVAVVYGRRRARDANPRELEISRSRGENLVSFAQSKRTSWNRSLSIRGRESILFAAGENFRPRHKPKGASKRPPRQGPRAKKPAPEPPDFTKEKAYFQEVDALELLEESPSPKNFGTWVMGAKQDYVVVRDLPTILERWKLSKLASRCASSSHPLFKITESPLVPSLKSSTRNDSTNFVDKTPEQVTNSRFRSNITSYERSSNSMSTNNTLSGPANEKCIVDSLDTLNIKSEVGESDSSEALEVLKEADEGEELEGVIKKDHVVPCLPSLGDECLTAFAQLLMVCRQSTPVSLAEVFSTYCEPSSIVKIGEGTYGEAFKAGGTVCKVVPIDGDSLVNGEIQKKSEEVLEEVLLSLTLNNLRNEDGKTNSKNSCKGFIETKDFRVCKGSYDAGLISAWEDWDAKHGSENDHPKDFSAEQVTAALAVAESACEFEHRDLHWGNILLARSEMDTMNFTIEGKRMSARTFGLAIAIIDFTLSRINTGEAILFLDLSADPGLFEGPKGDKQAETYRKMKEVTEDYWEGSFPKTNVLWLIYLVDILLLKKSFKRTAKDERDLRSFKKRLSSYESAKDCLSDSFFSDLLFT